MITLVDFILDFIRIDLMVGFGWYSILVFILIRCNFKKEFLLKFDKSACQMAVGLGILFFILWLTSVVGDYLFIMNSSERLEFAQRFKGPYSFGIWLQPLFLLMLTQLLRIRFVNRFLFFRILIVIPFIITFERFVIIYTSYCRDYLPSSWSMGYSSMELVISIPIKAAEFAITVFLFKFIKEKFPKRVPVKS